MFSHCSEDALTKTHEPGFSYFQGARVEDLRELVIGVEMRDETQNPKRPDREAKLAQALRANLRRRKARPDPKTATTGGPQTSKPD
jgi:hypothetical protein